MENKLETAGIIGIVYGLHTPFSKVGLGSL